MQSNVLSERLARTDKGHRNFKRVHCNGEILEKPRAATLAGLAYEFLHAFTMNDVRDLVPKIVICV